MKALQLDSERIEAIRESAGCEGIEVYLKKGRSRRLVRGMGVEHASEAAEQGWAVRAAGKRGSFFCTGTGEPGSETAWPSMDGFPIRFAEPAQGSSWTAPQGMSAPLATDSEIRLLVVALEKELARTLPSARLDQLVVEDGQSESVIGNSRGVLESWKGRTAMVTLEATAAPDRAAPVRLEVVERELREISPRRVARRLVDLLTVRHDGRPVARDRSEVVVAPRVASSLLLGLAPIFDAQRSADLLECFGDSRRLGGEALHVVDNGRLANGLLAAPVDGEGTPTAETVLVEAGKFRQPLLGWWESRQGMRSGGCSRRPSWRDEPRVAPTHLYIKPDKSVAAGDLIGSLSRGYYLLDSAPQARFDFSADRFELEVRGFEMLGGQVRGAISGVHLVGRISALLAGVRAVARDLVFQPANPFLVGSPSLLLGGLEIRRSV
jgi:predicted Zn-dependent protease